MGENRKSFWIVGIALIIFLILLLGSIIGLKLTRDGIYDELGKGSPTIIDPVEDVNYIVREDGSKENVSEEIVNAEFNIDGVKISHFAIEEKDGISTITANIENTTEEVIEGKSFIIKLYDLNDELITEFTMDTTDLEAQIPTITIKSLGLDCSNAARIELEMVGAQEEVSGEVLVSGEVQE